MKEQLIKWLPILALASFVAAVFMVTDGDYWLGVVFIGVGASFFSAASSYKKKKDDPSEAPETK